MVYFVEEVIGLVRFRKENYLSDEEYTARMKKEHPEYFDRDGSWLPTAITGVFGPSGVYIPTEAVKFPRKTAADKKYHIPEGWMPTVEKPVPEIRCTVVRVDGRPCRNKAILGGIVCGIHGGNRVDVQRNAQEVLKHARDRLLDITDSAVIVYEEILRPESGANDSVRLKAAGEVLDRVGLKAGNDIQVNITTVNYSELISTKLEKLGKLEEQEARAKELEAEVVVLDESDE